MKAVTYAAGFLFHGDQVLLIRKAKPEWQRGRLNGPGGKVESAETFAEAMEREFEEETGLKIEHWEHFATLTGAPVGDDPRDRHASEFVVQFFCAEWHGPDKPQLVAESVEEPLEWHSALDLPRGKDGVLPNLHWLVPMAFHGNRPDWPLLVVERAG